MKHRIEKQGKCKSCGATGLYKGMAEHDLYAVVCHDCKGTGAKTYVLEWEDFHRRLERDGVSRVLECNPGICVGGSRNFGGMHYFQWLRGDPFPPKSEMREYTCPAWWYQSADYDKKPDWEECGFGAFSACKHFPNKAQCWKRWDDESPGI